MPGNLYQRLYDRLIALIPQLSDPRERSSFFAPPRIKGDIALYCSVTRVTETSCEVEIAQDVMVEGRPQPAPWMAFRIDRQACAAELMVIEDQWRYEVVYADDGTPNPRQAQMNLFAVNGLAVMLNLGGVFRPVDVVATVEA